MRLGNPGLAVDSTAMESGKWVPCELFGGGIEVKVASMRSRSYRESAKARKIADLDGDALEVATTELIADTLLLGWKGVVDVDGNKVEYSNAMCRAVLLNPDNRRFLTFVMQVASSLDTFDVTGGVSKEEIKN